MPHATVIADRIMAELRTIDISTGDSQNVVNVGRFSRLDPPPRDLPAIRLQTFDQTNAAQGGDEEVGTVIKTHTFFADCFYARDAVDAAGGDLTDEIDAALAADVEAVARALDVDNTFHGKLSMRRWASFHNLDRDAADYGIRAELVATWRQTGDGAIIT
jgi:hypothetical protein